MQTDSDSVLDDLDRDYAPAWKPEPGGKVAGIVTDLSERDGAYGRYPIITLRTADGDELAVHAFHEVLQNELARIGPKQGDVLGVKYLGKDEERGYHRYRVRRRGADGGGVEWSRYGEPSEPASDVPADLSGIQAPLEQQGDHLAPEGYQGDDAIPF